MDVATSDSINVTSPEDRIKLNVGEKPFETMLSILRSAGPDSLLTALSLHDTGDNRPVFIDSDAKIFSVLPSLLRTNQLPSTALRFSKQELADEALYYGIDAQLRWAMAPPPLDGIDASSTATIRQASEGLSPTCTAGDRGRWIHLNSPKWSGFLLRLES